MDNPDILLIGAGGHARSCIEIIEQQGTYRVAGLVGAAAEIGGECLGYKIIATDDELRHLSRIYRYALIVVGQISSPDTRIRLYDRIVDLGFRLPTILSPVANVSKHASIGDGCIVMHGATVNASARIGANCIINSHALVEHDAAVEDHCHISTGAIVNGSARVGRGSFLGSGCIVRDGKTVGRNCVVGMGQHVSQDLADNTQLTGRKES